MTGCVSVGVKAGEAEDWAMPLRLEWHRGGMTACRARCIGDRSRVAATSFNASYQSAVGAAFGFVLQSFNSEEFLFCTGEQKFLAATAALQVFVIEHFDVSSRRLRFVAISLEVNFQFPIDKLCLMPIYGYRQLLWHSPLMLDLSCSMPYTPR